jgi:hypothetical protein
VESEGTTVRLHFANRIGPGALAAEHRVERMRELSAALGHARGLYPEAAWLRGGSWLYHVPGYRALFPADLLRNATESDARDELEFMALWGQFLRGDGTLFTPRADAFASAFTAAGDEAGLVSAFPLAKLDWSGPLEVATDWLEASTTESATSGDMPSTMT